ncbi:efflux RND transporter permease subunit [Botrimarina hoheduenensis]|uniref:MMPL family protein n=1 Tax=Botrimarina hoheduenensis TaxID=2528000 RepID=A0A5C5W9E8_9BACT|nr:MMPL family transporter [Botrimarina hoheduenensis]TWT46903.1 MMPL family protein [Botrimarina hoheduenensis]
MSGPAPETDRPVSLLDRRWGGLSLWLWIAMAAAVAMGMIPRGARRAIESNTNKAEDWLPASYAESADLSWFRDHFASEAFVLISWEGCTLGKGERLSLLEQKLSAVRDDSGWRWYPKIVSGPGTIRQLTGAPSGLDRSAAIERLEGALVGPPQTGADGQPLGDETRTTCLLAFLSPRLTDNNQAMRAAVERIERIAHKECGVPLDAIHMGGPPVDNVTIDKEGERTLVRLAGLSGLVGIVLSYVCFRSWKLTAMVFFTAVVNAGLSLAVVFYYGVFEVFGLGALEPKYGKADAILMSMPAVVYVLALSGAIHLINYYRDSRAEGGLFGAVERAIRVAWGPCALAAFTTAVGLGSLAASDILPIRKFGMFTAIGVMVAVTMLFALLPVMLHLFAPGDAVLYRRRPATDNVSKPWYTGLAWLVTTRPNLTAVATIALSLVLALGIPQIRTSVQLLKLLDSECDLITDYAWLEKHLGNLVPMEVIVGVGPERLRAPDEPAFGPAAEGLARTYRMTMHERATLVRRVQERIESLDPVSKALSSITFSPEPISAGGSSVLRASAEYATSNALEESRESLADYLQRERGADDTPTGRELWRISARVTALGDVDYGQFVDELREQVQPVLDAYRDRDALLSELASEDDRPLDKKSICLLFRSGNNAADTAGPDSESPAGLLAQLLKESSISLASARVLDTASLDQADEKKRARLIKLLSKQDAVFALTKEASEPLVALPGAEAIKLHVLDAPKKAPDGALDATYTGVVPVVYKTQRELLASLRESIAMATVLIAGVMMIVLRSPLAGLASMIPNLFPILVVFGAIGWLGIKVDIGIMMTASVALGVAVDDTLHFVTWFSRGIRAGMDRQTATLQSFERCATAMTQTTLIAGLGLAVFAASTFTPTQQFGTLMITMLAVALVGDLVLLPALLCGPLGKFFAPKAAAKPEAGIALVSGDGGFGLAALGLAPSDDGSPNGVTQGPTDEATTEAVAPAIVPFRTYEKSPAESEGTTLPAPHNSRLVAESETLEPENAALHAKLRGFRRPASQRDRQG